MSHPTLVCTSCSFHQRDHKALFCSRCGAPKPSLPFDVHPNPPSLIGYPVGLAMFRLEFLPVGAEFASHEEALSAARQWGRQQEHVDPVVTHCDSSVPEVDFPFICSTCRGFVEKEGAARPCRGCHTVAWVSRVELPAIIS